jgi:RNA polymerase sigma factor (sigma-70 family)
LLRKISDTAVIEGIRQQDDKILNWLYDNYHQTIRHHVLKNSGSEADVSDVFQESIITLYRQISENRLNLTSDLKGYFFGIARNIWSAQLRKKVRNTEIEFDPPDDDDDNEDSLNTVLERIVSRAFQKLSFDSQTILTLFSEGFSYPEIASKMNLKSETYARRKKYLSKENLMELIKSDPEYKDYLGLR